MRWWGALVRLALVVGLLAGRPARAFESTLLDGFDDIGGWTAVSSEGTTVWVVQEEGRTGMAMRVGYDLNSGGGWILVRKTFSLPLPPNYAFSFAIRGEGRPNNLEFKLIDASGKNVWWRVQRDFAFPAEWQDMTIRKSRIVFAWGPGGKRELQHVGTIEFALSASEGGSGSFLIDDLSFEPRERAIHDGAPPAVSASSALDDHAATRMLDGDPATSWRSLPVPDTQSVLLDFGHNCEFGGLAIDWDAEDYATVFTVEVSTDGRAWSSAYSTATGHGGRSYVYMPEAESRFVRIALQRSSRGQGFAIAALAVKPTDFSDSPNQFFSAIAADAPVGDYPKYFYGRQTYWTVVGVNRDRKEGLLNEEGMLEVDKGSFSIEPFLYAGGHLVTWHDATITQSLEEGYLPIPSVTWQHDNLGLEVTAFASGEPEASTLYARYRVHNRGDRAEPVQLFLALRPFQVNPPWQSLNMTGGVSAVREIRLDGRTVWVNRQRAVVALTRADRFGASTFEEGAVTEFLRAGRVPPRTEITDPFAFASGAFQYSLQLEPGAHADVYVAVPFHDPFVTAAAGLADDEVGRFVEAEREVTRRYWQTVLGRVAIELPPEAAKLEATLKTTLAYILINRDGPTIQPGSRNYARSWIRDGAITSAALLEMGFTPEVRDFLRWFVRYQAPDGKVPCCVDRRGPDPVSEHDSAGQLIFAVMEYYRYTRDVGFLSDMWPHVVKAVDYMTALRRRRMSDDYRTGDKEAYFGLLPESISHEGYSAHPVHSYWDDFFALRGLKDAADMAVVLGDDERAASIAALRDDFRQTLYASIARTASAHGIDYIPASVELGDFDPSSTSIALVPGGERVHLPEPALTRTYERYWADFETRRRGEGDSEGYTAYELRNVSALLQIGQKRRALEILAWFVADQRPPAWNEWAEISWRDPQAPRFIGDMPHTWVGAGYIRAVRSMVAYEREDDDALVLAAGIPAEWVMSDAGVKVRRLPTYWGILNYTLRGETADAVRLRLSGDLALPPGKIVVESPLSRPLRAVVVNGRPVETFTAEHAVVAEFPADVLLHYQPDTAVAETRVTSDERPETR
jgi:hypothetical protein